jgi:hypothetical protein
MTLLTFASRQTWPQVHALLDQTPTRLVLFHSDDLAESKRPAERVREFAIATGRLTAEAIELIQVPTTDLKGLEDAIADTAARLELGENNCQFHLTGGNKLMALAAFDWCRSAGSPCFYIEKEQKVIAFAPGEGGLEQRPLRTLNENLAVSVDPLDMVRCQLDAAEVVDSGQLLTLNAEGERFPWQEIGPRLEDVRYDFRRLLQVEGSEPPERAGDRLELATAVAILKNGIPRVRRGIRTVSARRSANGRDEGEHDLVFNWRGRLWIVDCKDRVGPERRIEKLRAELAKGFVSDQIRTLLDDLEQELRDKELKTLKEDLQAVAEAGGLNGKTIVVRREDLPVQARDFARSRKMDVVLRGHLFQQMQKCLFA